MDGERRSTMRTVVYGILASVLVLATAQSGMAKCGDMPGDDQAVADARAQVKSDCNCEGATSHGDFVSCAAGVANTRADNGQLPPNCKGKVKKCAAKSICGKPGFVTCCRTKADGTTKCSTKSSDTKCTPPKGGSACVSTFSSCCDACTASGCAASPSGAFLGDLAPGLF